MADKLQKLEKLLTLLDESLTKEDFIQAFELVVEYVKKNGVNTQQILSDLKTEAAGILKETSSSVEARLQKAFRDYDGKIRAFDAKVSALKDGKDGAPGEPGKDADEHLIIKKVIERIPTPDGETIVDKVNSLPVNPENQIDAKHIKNLPESRGGRFGGGLSRGAADKLYAPIGSSAGQVDSIVAGTNITVDDTDPANPIVSATGGVDTANSPNANEFARFTDANTIEGRTAAETKADLDLEIGTDIQAYSSNLDEYAAVNPTAAGLALLDDADASAQRTTLGLAIGTNVQAYSAVLAATTASFTTADETKLDGIEALADVTDAANVDAAGAVMNSDTSTASMSFVIDEDSMASDSATKVPTQQSVKAYVDANIGSGGVDTANSPNANEFARFTDADTIEGRTAAEVRADLDLEIGTDVQAYDADLTTWAGITPGANVGTALAVAVGTDGAFVVKGGALGTPSSGVATNITGLPAASVLAGTFGTGAYVMDTDLQVPTLKLGPTSTGVVPGMFVKDLAANFSIFGVYPQSGTNVNTSVQIFPKGTGQANNRAQLSVFNTDGVADTTNIEFLTLRATGTSYLILSGTGGTGTVRPISIYTGANTTQLVLNINGTISMGGTLGMGANSITMTGSLAATGSRVTKGWFTDIESTNMPTVGGTSLSSTFAPLASPTFTGTVTIPAAALNGQVNLDGTPASDHTAVGPVTNTFAAGYSSAIGDLVFMGSGGKWLEVDSDAVATCKGLMGIALEAKNDTEAMLVALPGSFVRDDSWNWTVGATLYAGETLGAMQEAIPTGADAIIKVVGFAVTADVIFFNPSPDQQSTVA